MSVSSHTQVAYDAGTAAAERLAPDSLGDEVRDVAHAGRAYQTESIIAGIVIGAALLIGFFVIATMNDALPLSDIYADPANESFVQSKNGTVDRIGDALVIGAVVIIVLFAAVILRVLRGL